MDAIHRSSHDGLEGQVLEARLCSMLRGAPKFQLWRAAGAILPSVCTDPTSADSGPTLVFIREWRHGHRRHFSTDRIGSGNTGLQNTAQIRLKMISLSLDGTYSNPPARLGILTGETTGLVWSGLVFRRDPPRTGPFPGSPKLRRSPLPAHGMDRPLKQPGIHLKTPPFSALNRSWSCQWAVSNPGPGVPPWLEALQGSGNLSQLHRRKGRRDDLTWVV